MCFNDRLESTESNRFETVSMKWCFDIVPAAAAALVEAAAAAAAARLAWLLGWKGVLGWGYMGEGSGPVWEDKIGAGNVPELLSSPAV